MHKGMTMALRACAIALVVGGCSPSLLAMPAHGLEIGGFGRPMQAAEVEAFLDRGARFAYRGKQLQPVGDWYQRNSRYYLLGDQRSMLAIGIGKEALSTDYFKPGTQLIRIHETGVPLSTQLSTFATLGWPQSNPDLRVFAQIAAVLSDSSGELRRYSLPPYAREGLLLVAPDQSRLVSRQAYGPVVLIEPGQGRVGMLWPDPKTLTAAREQVSREGRRLAQTGRYDHGSQFGLFEPYANYQWLNDSVSWYRKDGQWHLRGFGKTTEPEPLSTDFGRFLQSYYAQLVLTGKPPAWKNFRAGHPGFRVLPSNDPRLRQPCNCGPLYFLDNPLPLAFELTRPHQLLGVRVEAFGLSDWRLKPLLYTRQDKPAALAAMTRHFASRGLRMEPLNADYHVIRGGAVKVFVRFHTTADPSTLAIEVADHGDIYCVECHHD